MENIGITISFVDSSPSIIRYQIETGYDIAHPYLPGGIRYKQGSQMVVVYMEEEATLKQKTPKSHSVWHRKVTFPLTEAEICRYNVFGCSLIPQSTDLASSLFAFLYPVLALSPPPTHPLLY